MTTETGVTTYQPPATVATAAPVNIGPKHLDLIRRTLMPKQATNEHLALFVQVCKRLNLDPFLRQVYFTLDRGQTPTIMIGIDGYRAFAARSQDYEGRVGPEWCGPDGVWRDVWLAKEPPAAARVGFWRRGFRAPLYAVATWREFAKDSPTWRTMGPHMLANAAERHALRASFPHLMLEMRQVIEAESGSTVWVAESDEPARDPEPAQTFAVEAAEPAPDHSADAGNMVDPDPAPAPPPPPKRAPKASTRAPLTEPEQQAQQAWEAWKAACKDNGWEDPQRLRYYLATESGVPEKVTGGALIAWQSATGQPYQQLLQLAMQGELAHHGAGAEPEGYDDAPAEGEQAALV